MFIGIALSALGRVGSGRPTPPTPATTWNSADKHASVALSNGDLTAQNTASGANRSVRNTSGYLGAGKRYFEYVMDAVNVNGSTIVGIANSSFVVSAALGLDAGNSFGYRASRAAGAEKWGNFAQTAYGAVCVPGDVIGVALDMDAGTLTFYVNNVSQGVAFSGLTGSWKPALSTSWGDGGSGTGAPTTARFASSSWTYAPPAGHTEWTT